MLRPERHPGAKMPSRTREASGARPRPAWRAGAAEWEQALLASAAGDGHGVDTERRGGRGALQLQVVADQIDALEHAVQVRRDGDLAHGEGDAAILDVEAGGATGEVAGDGVEAEAHHLRHEQAAFGPRDDLCGTRLAGFEDEVRGGGANGAAGARGAGRGL